MSRKCSGKLIVLVMFFGILLGTPSLGQEKPALTPDQAWDALKKGNERFVTGKPAAINLGAEHRRELAKGQHPFAVVLTCADSRVVPEYLFNKGLGDIFVLRVAGNVADPFELGSMEFAVEYLHVPLIVVLGHTKCGAVNAAFGVQKPSGNLGRLIAEVEVGQGLPNDKAAALEIAIKNNALNQAESLTKRSEVLKDFVKHKKARIVSGVYSLETGKVEWLEVKEPK
jgi:carbonic anhydrase